MRRFGKYRLLEPLASGGMAEVWRAELSGPAGFAKEVALKLVRADLAGDPELARMFREEARLASRLGHANLVQVFDYDLVDGRPYLAMELVRGRTLRQVVDRCREIGARLGIARAVQVGAEVARGLAYAHRLAENGVPLGLVHRDVSPQNVLVSFEGEVKLADFGIARVVRAAETTAPGTVRGKLAYMAPEQARGEPVQARADVFALGVVLWELVTGRRLFARETDAATLAALLADQPVSRPSEWNEEVPAALDEVLLSALERDPGRRTASADDLLAALSAVRLELARGAGDLDLRVFMERLWPGGSRGDSVAEPTRRLAAGAPLAGEEAPTRTMTGARRGRMALAGLAAAVLALAVGAALWMAREKGRGTGLPAGSSTPLAAAPPSGPPPAAPTSPPPAGPPPTANPFPASAAPGIPPARPTAAPTRNPGPAAASPPPGRAAQAAAPAPRWPTGRMGSLALRRAGGEGILAVNATPWATVHIDGTRAGDTPREWRLPAGRYRVRATHPGRVAVEADLEVAAGQRLTWQPRLKP